jgi:hypothetical protein
MRPLRTTLALSFTLAVGVWATGSARADAPVRSSDDVARAEVRFHAGEQFFDDKQYEAACAAFEESERLDPQLGTLLNLAFCQERMGKTATAWHEYSIGAVWAEQRGQHDRAAWALGRAVEVSRRVPIILLDVPPTAQGYTIELDGSMVAPSAWGTPLSVDPGEHVVRVSSRGHRGQQLTLRVPEGPVTQGLNIPILEIGTEMAAWAPVEPRPRVASRSSNGRMVFGLAGIGVGVAALAVGSYFGVRTFAKKNEASSHCVGTECDATGVSLEADAHTSATASTVTFAVGGASLALGTWLALTSRSSASVGAQVQPLVGPRVAGLGLGGSW